MYYNKQCLVQRLECKEYLTCSCIYCRVLICLFSLNIPFAPLCFQKRKETYTYNAYSTYIPGCKSIELYGMLLK